MVKVEQTGGYGEMIKGTILRAEQVRVVGAIDDENKYVVAMTVSAREVEEPLVLMFTLEFAPTVARLLKEKSDELNAGMTAPKI